LLVHDDNNQNIIPSSILLAAGCTVNTPGKKTAPVVSDKVRISADKATNSLIIMADMEDYVGLESIIKKIDIPRAMVYIEALIMEVSVTKDFRLGTEWILGGETIYQDKSGVYGGGIIGDFRIFRRVIFRLGYEVISYQFEKSAQLKLYLANQQANRCLKQLRKIL